MACTCWAPECVCGRGPGLVPRVRVPVSQTTQRPVRAGAPRATRGEAPGREAGPAIRGFCGRWSPIRVSSPRGRGASAKIQRPGAPGAPQPSSREHTDTRNPCDRPVPLRAFTGAVAITAHNPECRTGFPPARDAERGRTAPRTCARSDRPFSVLALHAPPTRPPATPADGGTMNSLLRRSFLNHERTMVPGSGEETA